MSDSRTTKNFKWMIVNKMVFFRSESKASEISNGDFMNLIYKY